MSATPYQICLIEDDQIIGEALLDRFDLEGFTCDWHNTGKTGIAAIDRRSYDIVISDICLPDIDGEELFLRLKQQRDALPPFIFITGDGRIDSAVRLLKLGAEDYLTKPFDIEVLLDKLRLICARSRQKAAPACYTLSHYVQLCEKHYIERALLANGRRIGQTAVMLGISRKSLWEKMRKLGLADNSK